MAGGGPASGNEHEPRGPLAVPHKLRVQFAALPYRIAKDGGLEFLLITSRTTRRWIIPKGWPMGDRPPHKVAAREALEEAGVEGKTGKRPIGAYFYEKLLSNGTLVPCHVEVFALKVDKIKSAWPERKMRDRRWLPREEAAREVSDRELAPLIRAFEPDTAKPDAAKPGTSKA